MVSEGQTTQTRKIDSFNKISVKGNMAVYLTKGQEEKFEIEVKDSTIDPSKVTTEMNGKELKIRMMSHLLRSQVKVKINITYKEISEINADVSSEIFIDSVIRGEKIILRAMTNGTITLTVDVDSIKAEVTEGSLITISGKAKTQNIEVGSGGTYTAFDLTTDVTTVKANSKGKAKINVMKELNATTSTGGYINYLGHPNSKTINNKLGGKVVQNTDKD